MFPLPQENIKIYLFLEGFSLIFGWVGMFLEQLVHLVSHVIPQYVEQMLNSNNHHNPTNTAKV